MTDSQPSATPPLAIEPDLAPNADPYRVYLDSLDGSESRRTMAGCLDRIARMFIDAQRGEPLPHEHPPITGEQRSWWALRYEDTTQIRMMVVATGWSPAHVNKHIFALHRVLEESWRLKRMTAEEYHRAASIKSVEAKREPAGRNIHHDELGAMLRVCRRGDGPTAVRNAALVAVLHCTGMRREEAANALIERYDTGERSLQIIGKGNKERVVYISLAALPHHDRWLALLDTRTGPLYRPIDRWGNVRADSMGARAIGAIVDRIRRQAGLPPMATHDFRRTFIGDFIDAGGDLLQAQRLAGHASAATTARYDRRPGRALRAAVDRMSLPSLDEEAMGE